jgi:hypothetical protein
MSELVRRFIDALDALAHSDPGPMAQLLDRDIEFVTPAGELRGHAQAMERFRASTGGAVRNELALAIDAEDCAALEFVLSGDGWQMRATDHIWWRDEKIYRFHAYFDPAEPGRQR